MFVVLSSQLKSVTLHTFHTIYFCAEDYVEVAEVSTYDAIPFI